MVRALIVDDYEPLRVSVRSMLKVQPHLEIVGEASDGLEAVQKAIELKPDLILLDISLPNLNGIQAAESIHRAVPGARILFLSQNTDVNVIRAALSNGAKGYVLKAEVGHELLPAIEAVIRGERFVSSRINL